MKPIKSFVGIATRNFSYYSGRFPKTKVLLILDLGFHVIITYFPRLVERAHSQRDGVLLLCHKLNFSELQQRPFGIMNHNLWSVEKPKYLKGKLGDLSESPLVNLSHTQFCLRFGIRVACKLDIMTLRRARHLIIPFWKLKAVKETK